MPTYEYRCKDCGEHLEVVQKFTDDSLTECPACQGQLRKVFGNIGIVLKGSGFYKNDSRSGGGATAGSKGDKGEKSDKSESTSESTKSDSSSSNSASDSATKTEKKSESSSKSDSGSSSSTAAAS